MSEIDSEVVLVREYLVQQGFSDIVAVAITMHALINSVALSVEEIQALAEELGYSFDPAGTYINPKHMN